MKQESPETGNNAVVVLPVLNEADYIVDALYDLRGGNAGVPIWVMDGGSTDGTLELLHDLAAADALLQVIHNPGRLQSYAINLAAYLAQNAGYDVLVRADGHCRYPTGFVNAMVILQTHLKADSVTVPLIATKVGYNRWQLANGDLQRNWLGNGGAQHRNLGRSTWVDHGHHAAFLLSRFMELDGYDTDLSACEDVDYDLRQRAAGGRIWLASNWPVVYMPRTSPRTTWLQMLRNGMARTQVAKKNHRPLNRRQLLPVLACSALIAAPFGLLWWPVAVPAVSYLMLVFALSVQIGRKGGIVHSLRIAALAITAHMGFSAGVLRGFSRRLIRGVQI